MSVAMNSGEVFCRIPTKSHVALGHRNWTLRGYRFVCPDVKDVTEVTELFDLRSICVNRPTVAAIRSTYASRGFVGSRPVTSAIRFKRYRTVFGRSEESRVGKECVGTCRSRWSPYHSKKTQKE